MTKTALPVALAILLVAPPPLRATPTGSIAGQVLAPPTGHAPAITVFASSEAPQAAPASAAVATDGSFRLEGLPAGRVHLAVATSDGLYPVAVPVAVPAGGTRTVHLALAGRQDTNADDLPPDYADDDKKKGGLGFWNNPLTASLVVIGAAIAVGVLVDQLSDDDNPTPTASPSTSTP